MPARGQQILKDLCLPNLHSLLSAMTCETLDLVCVLCVLCLVSDSTLSTPLMACLADIVLTNGWLQL